MDYDPKDIFRKHLKKYVYLLSLQETMTSLEAIALFEPILRVLRDNTKDHDFNLHVHPNEIYTEMGTGVLDIWLSYNPNIKLDEEALVKLLREGLATGKLLPQKGT